MLNEPEITQLTRLVEENNRLNPNSVGWMRQPLIDTSGIDGRHSWGRNKRWEYWNVVTDTHILALTISAIDYAGVHEVWVYNRLTGENWGLSQTDLFAPPRMPANLGDGDTRIVSGDLAIAIDENPHGTRLRAKIPGASFDVFAELPVRHERLGLVVPWSDKRFQYTVKDICRPASGWVKTGQEKFPVLAGKSWAVLDHGRGRWPYDVNWNWGAASGTLPASQVLFEQHYLAENLGVESSDHVFGIQMGAKWTDGTGVNENSIYLDGTIYKIHEDIDWQYDLENWNATWRMKNSMVDLEFIPFYNKVSRTDMKLISSRTDQCFGTYQGVIRLPGVGKILITDLVGWAEDVHNRW